MSAIKNTIDRIGRGEIADRLGVKRHAISMALSRGRLPAAWYLTIRDLAEVHGLEIRDDWFNWAASHSDTTSGCAQPQPMVAIRKDDT